MKNWTLHHQKTGPGVKKGTGRYPQERQISGLNQKIGDAVSLLYPDDDKHITHQLCLSELLQIRKDPPGSQCFYQYFEAMTKPKGKALNNPA